MDEGVLKGDRTGTGTKSIFHHTLELDMADGFPLLTTKKMFTKGIIHELLWLLNGDTNIKYLVNNGVNIWTGDAYKKYEHYHNNHPTIHSNRFDILSQEDFVDKINNFDDDDHFVKEWGDLGPIYGKQWREWKTLIPYDITNENCKVAVKTIDQIQNVIDQLNNNPDGRRIMVSAWNVGEISEMTLPPCHWAFEFYTEELTHDERIKIVIDTVDWVRDSFDPAHEANKYLYRGQPLIYGDLIPYRKLSLKWHQRSCDTFLGIPFNIASYGFLLHMVAQQVNMIPDKLIGDLTNVHIYKNHFDQVAEQLSRTNEFDSPKLILNKAKDIFSYKFEDFKIEDYKSHSSIKAPLSN